MQGYANIRSKEIVDFFSHVRPNGEERLDSVIAKSDYRTAGENIAAGNKDARSTFEQWKNSQGHRDNMLNPNFTHMTVGSCYGDGIRLKLYLLFCTYLFHNYIDYSKVLVTLRY